ncbi:hypothetical protein [Solidesulfovibrio sp. C21]|uniref:hypothetical protein n=1 Tax=Solidesulfovibrio sp. C21 TaxID=3398613 RepID=UPI0039FD5C0A
MEIKIEDIIEKNIHLVDCMLFNESVSESNGNVLITDSRDVTFELKAKHYNKSFPIPGYTITQTCINLLKKSGIKGVYLYENENLNDISIFFVNQGYKVNVLKDINSKTIQNMSSKEIDRFCVKSMTYYKYWLTVLSTKNNILNKPEVLEQSLSELLSKLNFSIIDNEQFDQFLGQDVFSLQDKWYNPLIYQLAKRCIVQTLQKIN